MSRLVSFYGDSLTIGSGVGVGYKVATETLFPSETFTVNINNLSNTEYAYTHMKYHALKYYPDILFVNSGNHDASLATPTVTATYKAQVKIILQSALDMSAAKKIFWISTLPVDNVTYAATIVEYNVAAQEAIAEINNSRLSYVDTFTYMVAQGFTRPDGIHYATSSMQACAAAIFQPLLANALLGVIRNAGYLNRQHKLSDYLLCGPALKNAQAATSSGTIPIWSKTGLVTATLSGFTTGGYRLDPTIGKNCVVFDGVGKVALNYKMDLYDTDVFSDKTFEFWIVRTGSGTPVLLEQYLDSNNYIHINLNINEFHIQIKSGGIVKQCLTNAVIDPNAIHVLYVKRGFVHDIYVNGVLEPLRYTLDVAAVNYAKNATINLGYSTYNQAYNFQGKILSNSIYNYAISAEDAAELYSYGPDYGLVMDAGGGLSLISSGRKHQSIHTGVSVSI